MQPSSVSMYETYCKGSIMKEHCVDLEIAKELKENGFPQESFFSYRKYEENIYLKYPCGIDTSSLHVCFAPTSDEILKELPTYLAKDNLDEADSEYFLNISKDYYSNKNKNDFYEVSYDSVDGKGFNYPDNICIEDDKLSNALATFWLYLKKEGYIK